MSYKLKKYCTQEEKNNFIVEYNHNKSMPIENGVELVEENPIEFIYALEKNEIMQKEEIEVEVVDYDENGNEIGKHTKTITLNYPIIDPEYEEKEAQKERNRIAMLSLTRGDVFRGLLQAKQVTRVQIRQMIENNELLTILEREMALIDFDEALNFYRGNPLIDTIGLTLGITTEQLDEFFETGDWTCLIVPVEEDTNIENLEA